jgi:quinoprotein relay system zinc metallohydrolase 2
MTSADAGDFVPVVRTVHRASSWWLLAACGAIALPLGAWAHTLRLPALAVENPAPGVYVHYGVEEEMTPLNAGDIANLSFVVGQKCVAVIDTGGTLAVGRALRAAVRRATPLPICYVINTHLHPDHVFGNQAFVRDRPQFVGHVHLADSMRRRGPNYLRALMRDLGSVAVGTTLVLPTHGVAGIERLDLGSRILTVRAWPTAHTDTDLTVFDEKSGTLFLGDLGFVDHIPVVDGNLRGFIAALGELKTIPAQRAIPGHGRADAWPSAIIAEERYLVQLRHDVRAAIVAGVPLAQAIESVECEDADHWLLIDQFHRRNVSAAYAELEWE